MALAAKFALRAHVVTGGKQISCIWSYILVLLPKKTDLAATRHTDHHDLMQILQCMLHAYSFLPILSCVTWSDSISVQGTKKTSLVEKGEAPIFGLRLPKMLAHAKASWEGDFSLRGCHLQFVDVGSGSMEVASG